MADPSARLVETQWNPATPAPRDSTMFRIVMLDNHNAARRVAGVASLDWDDALASDAKRYAQELAATHRFVHAPRIAGGPVEGENLWMGTRSAFSYASMADTWIDEQQMFQAGAFPNISRTGSWHDVGHYTQVVWAETRLVGCAVASNDSDDYLVCRYFPAGNVLGENPLGEGQKMAATSFANASAR